MNLLEIGSDKLNLIVQQIHRIMIDMEDITFVLVGTTYSGITALVTVSLVVCCLSKWDELKKLGGKRLFKFIDLVVMVWEKFKTELVVIEA